MMTPMAGIYRRRCRRGRAARGRRGFTLVELMVSVSIMVVMLLAVGKIFKMSSDASGLVIAHTEVLERLETIARVIEADLRNIRPGLLIIDSPGSLRTTDIEDATGAVQGLFDTAVPPVRFRSDGLAFFSSGGPNLHQSHWSSPPAASGEAIIFYGHSWPGGVALTTPASNWALCRRSILMLPNFNANDWPSGHQPVFTTPASVINIFQTSLPNLLRKGDTDSVDAGTLDNLSNVVRMRIDSARPVAPGANWGWNAATRIYGVWTRTELPPGFSVSADPQNNPNITDYRRAGALLAEHVGDFVVQWTDGTTYTSGASRGALRWFPSDIADDGAYDEINDLKRDQSIEEYVTGTLNYRAIWNATTWDKRPRALRITVRLYDGNQRLRESVGLVDNSVIPKPFTVTRYGQEHQVIIPIP